LLTEIVGAFFRVTVHGRKEPYLCRALSQLNPHHFGGEPGGGGGGGARKCHFYTDNLSSLTPHPLPPPHSLSQRLMDELNRGVYMYTCTCVLSLADARVDICIGIHLANARQDVDTNGGVNVDIHTYISTCAYIAAHVRIR